jgi:hypothetical protein
MMTPEDFKVGMRVRIVQPVEVYPLGIWPPGTLGTVVEASPIDPTTGEWPHPCAMVKLDDHFKALDEWDNCLQVFPDEADCLPECFEPVVGFV